MMNALIISSSIPRTAGAIILAPAATMLFFFLTGIFISAFVEQNFVFNKSELGVLAVMSVYVGFIAGMFTVILGLPLHIFLYWKNRMHLRYYLLVALIFGFLSIFTFVSVAEAEGINFGIIWLACCLICAGSFWYFAVDNGKSLFENLNPFL